MMTTSVITQLENIPVPRFEQEERLWCGPAVLQSLLAFHKCFVTQKEITKSINMDDGCFIQDLGNFALSKNFGVQLLSYDMIYLDPSWSSLDEYMVAEKLKNRLEKLSFTKVSRNSYKTLIKYLSNGGKLSMSLPKKDDIISIIQSGKPIIALVNSNSLYDRSRLDYDGKLNDITGSAGGHFVILTGYKNGYFFITDPSYDNPTSFVQEDRFLFSLSLWGGWMMVIDDRK